MQFHSIKILALTTFIYISSAWGGATPTQAESLTVLRRDAMVELKKCNPSEYQGLLKQVCIYFTDNENGSLELDQECVSKYRKKLEDSNKTYLPEDTCQQLKEKFTGN